MITPELSSNDRFQERFRREARSQAALDHPNVVTVHDFGEADGQLYISMQLVTGPSLKDLVARGGLDLDRVTRLLRPIADALDTAHDAGMIHRDFKPQNILIGGRDHAYLADFGLMQRWASPASRARASSSARSTTSRQSRSTARRPRAAATCTRSAPCCSSALPAASRTSASRTPRSCSPTSPSRRRARARSAPTCPCRSTPCSSSRWPRTPEYNAGRRALTGAETVTEQIRATGDLERAFEQAGAALEAIQAPGADAERHQRVVELVDKAATQ